MNLGEALTLRARQAQRMNDLKGRIKASAVVQEGDDPPEDANNLIAAYIETSLEHKNLMIRITATNASKMVEEGQTLAQLLQEREALIRERNLYSVVADSASPGERFRYMRSEIKMVPKVDIAELRGLEEQLIEDIRQLDVKIQTINWTTELY